jgi:hypothetical protein
MITEQDIEVVADAIRKACDFAADDKEGEYFGFYSARIDAVAQTAAQSIVPILVERCAGVARDYAVEQDRIGQEMLSAGHMVKSYASKAAAAIAIAIDQRIRSLAYCGMTGSHEATEAEAHPTQSAEMVERAVIEVIREQIASTDYPVSDYERQFAKTIIASIPHSTEVHSDSKLADELENRQLIRGRYYILMPHLRDRILAALRAPSPLMESEPYNPNMIDLPSSNTDP